MKKTDFTVAGGFPFEQKTLDYMQKAYFQILDAFVGHLNLPTDGAFIISGCELTPAGISKGMMFIDGDLCPCAEIIGANQEAKIAKIETIETADFETAGTLNTYFDYTAQENEAGYVYADFQRVANVPDMVNQAVYWNDIQNKPKVVVDPFDPDAVPAQLTLLERIQLLESKCSVFQNGGGMVLWNKPANQIPAGWAEVVNWRGRMPVGVDPSILPGGAFTNPEFAPMTTGQIDPGRMGGQKQKTLSVAEMPEHDHIQGSESLYNYFGGGELIGNRTYNNGPEESYKKQNTSKTGQGQAFSILNPYRTVLFIEWVGF